MEKNSEIDERSRYICVVDPLRNSGFAFINHRNYTRFWTNGRWTRQPASLRRAVAVIVAESARQHAHCGKAVDADRSCGE